MNFKDIEIIVEDNKGSIFINTYPDTFPIEIIYYKSEYYPFEEVKTFKLSNSIYYKYFKSRIYQIDNIYIKSKMIKGTIDYNIDLTTSNINTFLGKDDKNFLNFKQILYQTKEENNKQFQENLSHLINEMSYYKKLEHLYDKDIVILSRFLSDYGKSLIKKKGKI